MISYFPFTLSDRAHYRLASHRLAGKRKWSFSRSFVVQDHSVILARRKACDETTDAFLQSVADFVYKPYLLVKGRSFRSSHQLVTVWETVYVS